MKERVFEESSATVLYVAAYRVPKYSETGGLLASRCPVP